MPAARVALGGGEIKRLLRQSLILRQINNFFYFISSVLRLPAAQT